MKAAKRPSVITTNVVSEREFEAAFQSGKPVEVVKVVYTASQICLKASAANLAARLLWPS
jgi:hypothetical protein